MHDAEKLSLEQIRAFLEASQEVQFQARDRKELYDWVERALRQQDYERLPRQGKGVGQRYTRADIELLAAVDEAHETLSGPATQKILQRELYDFGDRRYERLAQLSVAHLYRLRNSRAYRNRRVAYQPTRPTQVSIGER